MGDKRGRPRIGPKVQASVPPEVAKYIKRQQKARGERAGAITRELIMAGYRAATGEA